jgi:hypothetical protein
MGKCLEGYHPEEWHQVAKITMKTFRNSRFEMRIGMHLTRLEPLAEFCINLGLTLVAGSSLADFYTLKMEAICSSETPVYTISRRLHIPEDGILDYKLLSGFPWTIN